MFIPILIITLSEVILLNTIISIIYIVISIAYKICKIVIEFFILLVAVFHNNFYDKKCCFMIV